MRYVAEHPDATLRRDRGRLLSRAATASWRCSRSRRATSRRAPRAPARSSSRAATAARSSPAGTTCRCAPTYPTSAHVLDEAQDEARRRELTEAAHRGHRRVRPLHVPRLRRARRPGPARRPGTGAGSPVLRVAEAAGRVHDWVAWRRVWWRIAEGRLLRFAGRLRPARTATDARRPRRPSCRSRRCALDADSRTLKEAVSLSRTGMRSIVVELSRQRRVVGRRPDRGHQPVAAGRSGGPLACRRGGAAAAAVERAAPARRTSSPRWLTLASINRKTAMALPPADLYWVHSVAQLPAVAAGRALPRRTVRLRRPRLLLGLQEQRRA